MLAPFRGRCSVCSAGSPVICWTMSLRSMTERARRSMEATTTWSPRRTCRMSACSSGRSVALLPDCFSVKVWSHSPTASSCRARFWPAEDTRRYATRCPGARCVPFMS